MTLTRLAATAAMLAALTATAMAKPVTLGAETNMRKAPDTKSEVVTLMPKGQSVEVGDCDAGWCKVSWNGQDGYAIARNLGAAAPKKAQRRVVRRYVEDDDAGPPVVYEDGPLYPVGPPVYYGYYPYPRAYWYGGRGWRGGWHHYRRW